MDLRPLLCACLLGAALNGWSQPAIPVPAVPEDPLYLPPEAQDFARTATKDADDVRLKLQALLRAIFRARDHGGLGLVYDNDRTRTVAEVWRDGKANCLSLTAFYVAACRSVGIRDHYAEVLNITHWRKSGSIIRFERHVVALTPIPPKDDLVADFMPDLRVQRGRYQVEILPEARFLALYHSNRAVEYLASGELDAAKAQAQLSQDSDPRSGVGWNVLGVVEETLGNLDKAEAAFRKAMDLDPKDGTPIGNMEALMRLMGRDAEALNFRRLGEKVRVKDPYFNAYVSEEALKEGDLVEARARAKAAIKLLPKDANFHLLLARVNLMDGDLDNAVKEIREAQRWSDPSERGRFETKLDAIRDLKEAKPVPAKPGETAP